MASDSYAFHACRMPTAYRYIDAKKCTCPWVWFAYRSEDR